MNTITKSPAQLRIARWIQQECGVKHAAIYMKDCGWSLEAALFNLLHTGVRN